MWRARLLPLIAVATGCHIAFPIEPLDGNVPKVYSSPRIEEETLKYWGGYPSSFSLTLAADLPGTTIYYTLDGSVPDLSSTYSTTPITGITIPATTTVRYFGVNGDARSEIVSEEVIIDSATAIANAGYLITQTTLDGNSPVVIASPGAALTGRASFQTWVQPSCTTCTAQVVFGVGTTDQGCLYSGEPNKYPGVMLAGRMFTVRAPMEPGSYEVRVAHIEQYTCDEAIDMMPLAKRPTGTRIGVIIVR